MGRLLEDLPAGVMRLLVEALDLDSAWRKVAIFLQFFDQDQIILMETSDSPSEKLLFELSVRCCTIENLEYILEQCKLTEALGIVAEPEPMQIISQPDEILGERNYLVLAIGEEFILKFELAGLPLPKYCWLRDGKEIQGQNSKTLHVKNFLPEMEGSYSCCATQSIPGRPTETIISKEVYVKLLLGPIRIKSSPNKKILALPGLPLVLKIEADGYPAPQFEWTYQNAVLPFRENILRIAAVDKSHGGVYKCRIHNEASEEIVDVFVDVRPTGNREPVKGKVALLIGNEQYDNISGLKTPSNDVDMLENALRQLGFNVYQLKDLDLNRMRKAIKGILGEIEEDSYVLFFYGGHGFALGEKFLLPTDAPENYMKKHSIGESEILHFILKSKPRLFVCLLDMCLKLPDHKENPDIYTESYHPLSYKTQRNLIQAYSTSNQNLAYENKNSPLSMYVSILIRLLKKDMPILYTLTQVHKDFESTFPNAAREQMPQITHNIAEDYYLTAPIANK